MHNIAKRRSVLITKLTSVVLALVLVLFTQYGCFSDILRGYFTDNPITAGPIENPRSLQELADVFFNDALSDYSTYNQLIAHPENFDIERPEPSFGDYSYAADAASYTYARELLREVTSHDSSTLEEDDLRLYNNLVFYLEATLGLEGHFYIYDPYEPSLGVHASLPITLMTFTFRTQQDIDDYLVLAADIPRVFDQTNEIVNERTRQQIVPNRATIQSSIGEAEAYTADVSNNILVTSFEDSLNSDEEPFASLSQAQRDEYADANRRIVREEIIPAYENAIRVLDELFSHATNDTTLASYPHAREYVAAELRSFGFSTTPEEAISSLDAELDNIMDTFTDLSNYAPADQDAIINRNLPDDAAGIIEYFNSRVAEDFPDIGERQFTVDAASDNEVMEAFTAFYMLAPVDDLNANMIKYYPQNIAEQVDLATTLAHESFPGHLYQYNYFGLTDPHPLELLLSTTAYMEGYAVYSQSYALRYMGFNENEAAYLNSYELLFRVLNARVDLGINYEGWNLETTRNYLKEWGLESAASAFFDSCVTNPMVSIPYGLAPLKFYEWRQTARDRLGDAFDIKEFHTVLLQDGGLPLEYVEENIYAWIDERAQR